MEQDFLSWQSAGHRFDPNRVFQFSQEFHACSFSITPHLDVVDRATDRRRDHRDSNSDSDPELPASQSTGAGGGHQGQLEEYCHGLGELLRGLCELSSKLE